MESETQYPCQGCIGATVGTKNPRRTVNMYAALRRILRLGGETGTWPITSSCLVAFPYDSGMPASVIYRSVLHLENGSLGEMGRLFKLYRGSCCVVSPSCGFLSDCKGLFIRSPMTFDGLTFVGKSRIFRACWPAKTVPQPPDWGR